MKSKKTQSNKFMRYVGCRTNKLSISGISVRTDWYILLSFIVIIFIILMIWSLNTFWSINESLNSVETTSNSDVILKEREMRAVLDDLLERRNIPAVKEVLPEEIIDEE